MLAETQVRRSFDSFDASLCRSNSFMSKSLTLKRSSSLGTKIPMKQDIDAEEGKVPFFSLLTESATPDPYIDMCISRTESFESASSSWQLEDTNDIVVEDDSAIALATTDSNPKETEEAATTGRGEINITQKCCICFETIPSYTSIVVHTQNPCGVMVCRTCLVTFLTVKIKAKEVGDETLKCPSDNCNESITIADVRKHIGYTHNRRGQDALFQEYVRARTETDRITAERDKRLRKFIPNAKDWADDIAFSCWKSSKDVKRCPGCRYVIEKTGGCSHMTCRVCRHEFYWCCGRDYKSQHNAVLCAPIRYINHPSPLWGPILPVRAMTKTVGASVILGLGTAAAGLVGTGLVLYGISLPFQLAAAAAYKKTGVKAWCDRHREECRERERAARAEHTRRLREENLRAENERIARDAAILCAYIESWKASSDASQENLIVTDTVPFEARELNSHSFEDPAILDQKTMTSDAQESNTKQLKMINPSFTIEGLTHEQLYDDCVKLMNLRTRRVHREVLSKVQSSGGPDYSYSRCLLCYPRSTVEQPSRQGLNYQRSVGGTLLHLFQDHDESDERRVEVINAYLREISEPSERSADFFGNRECALLKMPGKKNSIIQNELKAIQDAMKNSSLNGEIGDNMLQSCRGCSHSFDNVFSLATHVANRSPDRFLKAMEKPGACGVTIAPGYYCPCVDCHNNSEDKDIFSLAMCSRCNHPRALHNNYMRSRKN